MTKTFKISDKDFWYQINDAYGNGGGAYRLFVKGENDDVVSIPRILSVDENGRLYVGKADSYVNRVIDLKKSVDPKYKSSGHEFGERFKLLTENSDKFKYEHPWIELSGSDNPTKQEEILLADYKGNFWSYHLSIGDNNQLVFNLIRISRSLSRPVLPPYFLAERFHQALPG